MTQFLPANLLALFAPRDPLPYLPPPQPKHVKEACTLTGIGGYAGLFEDPAEAPDPVKVPSRIERREAKRKEKEEVQQKALEEEKLGWDPHNDPNASGDAFKTVFVSRINYDTREDKLRREFEEFGYIRRVNMVKDISTGKPRGYAFIEYETEKGMRSAYKYGDGKKIDGRRVVVDIERGRTVKNWKPRRFGGGLGGSRIGAPESNMTHSGRVEPRQYQEKVDKAERARQRMLNPDSKDERDRSRSRDKSRDKSRDRSERRRSVEGDRAHKDEEKPPQDRRIRRDNDRGERPERKDDDRERKPRERDDDRRRDRDDRKRDRRDEDRDRDRDRKRDRRDRDRGERGDRDRSERDRGDRDRSRGDRDGSERDRSRGDRDGDRGDRDGDRGDRDGDRDRDRDREGDRDKDRSERSDDKDKDTEKEKHVEDVEKQKDYQEAKVKEEEYNNEQESVPVS